MEEKIAIRLAELYTGRYKAETNMVRSLRYSYDQEKITQWIEHLAELRGRIWQLEELLPQSKIQEIKNQLPFKIDY